MVRVQPGELPRERRPANAGHTGLALLAGRSPLAETLDRLSHPEQLLLQVAHVPRRGVLQLGTKPGAPREPELTLRIPPESLSRLMQHRLLRRFGAGAASGPRRLVSTYYDTPDFRLSPVVGTWHERRRNGFFPGVVPRRTGR